MKASQVLTANPLMTPAEVATAFRVDPKTVTRWAKAGKLSSIRTLGGHRRYLESEVRAILADVSCDEEWHEPPAAIEAWEPPRAAQRPVSLGSNPAIS
jgi:excisionase family DNA binding protein